MNETSSDLTNQILLISLIIAVARVSGWLETIVISSSSFLYFSRPKILFSYTAGGT